MPVRDLAPNEIIIPSDIASGSQTPGMSVSPQMRDLSPDETVIAPASGPTMSPGDMGRALMTMGVRGVTNLADTISDPLSLVRGYVSPELEQIEQSVRLGHQAGTGVFNATGVPEYQPTTPLGRVGMAAGTGLVAGAPFGPAGAAVGLLGGVAGQGTSEATGSDRLGMLASLVPGGALTGLSTRAASRMTPELNAAGVNPTFGQAMGGLLNRVEQGIGSFPFVGDFMKLGRAQAIEQFNRGAINNYALAPIGEQLDPSTPLGRPAINEMRSKIGNAFDTVTGQLGDTSLRTPTFDTGLDSISARRLSESHKQLLTDTYNDEVLHRVDPDTGTISGQAYRDIDSTLGQLGTDHLHSLIPADRAFGNAIMDLRDLVTQEVKNSNPEAAARLQAVKDAYKHAERISLAASRLGTGLGGQSEPGVFTPSQLTSATQSMDPTLRHHAFAEGNAVLQDYAEAGRKLLGDTVPDSGTATRAAIGWGTGYGGAKAAAAYGLLDPATVASLALGTGSAALAYSPPGRAAMNYFLRRPEQEAAATVFARPSIQSAQQPPTGGTDQNPLVNWMQGSGLDARFTPGGSPQPVLDMLRRLLQ